MSEAAVDTNQVLEVESSKCTEIDMDNLRPILLRDGIVLENISQHLDLNDIKNLQGVNKEFNYFVTWHDKWWDQWRVNITMSNIKEIANHPPKRVWKCAKLELIPRKGFKILKFVWEQLEDLIATNSTTTWFSTQLFSGYLVRDVLAHAMKLKRLTISANLLCQCDFQDLQNLENSLFVSNLTDLEIVNEETEHGIMQRIEVGRTFDSHFELLSGFNWSSLETFKTTVSNSTICILSSNFLQNVRYLNLNTNFPHQSHEASFWSLMNNIQMVNMKQLTTRLKSSDDPVYRNFRSFLDNQPQMTSLHLQVYSLTPKLCEINENLRHPYPLTTLYIEFGFVEFITVNFEWLSKFVHLESFTLKANPMSLRYHARWPPRPSAHAILDVLPPSITHLCLVLCTGVDGRRQTTEMKTEELKRRALLLLPKIKHLNYVVTDCIVCKIRNRIEVDDNHEDINRLINRRAIGGANILNVLRGNQ